MLEIILDSAITLAAMAVMAVAFGLYFVEVARGTVHR